MPELDITELHEEARTIAAVATTRVAFDLNIEDDKLVAELYKICLSITKDELGIMKLTPEQSIAISERLGKLGCD